LFEPRLSQTWRSEEQIVPRQEVAEFIEVLGNLTEVNAEGRILDHPFF